MRACGLLSSLDDGRSSSSASIPPRPAEPRGGRERSRNSGTCGLADDDPQTSAGPSFLAPASILRLHQSTGSGICRDDDSDLHVGPFAAHVIADLETQIAAIDRGERPETMRMGQEQAINRAALQQVSW
jgi:hypothetical protein